MCNSLNQRQLIQRQLIQRQFNTRQLNWVGIKSSQLRWIKFKQLRCERSCSWRNGAVPLISCAMCRSCSLERFLLRPLARRCCALLRACWLGWYPGMSQVNGVQQALGQQVACTALHCTALALRGQVTAAQPSLFPQALLPPCLPSPALPLIQRALQRMLR